jgi:type IV secretion system protein VirD4
VSATQSGPRAWVTWCVWLIGICLATLAAMWLAGALLFLLHKKNPLGLVGLGTWFRYWDLAQGSPAVPALVKKLKLAALGGGLLGYGVPLLLLLSARTPRKLHGDARFAKSSEIKAAGLFQQGGILVGRYRGKYLSFGGQQFPLVVAPTRSGKGVGIVIPNLLSYPDSVVVLDIKGENFKKTAGFRAKHGQQVYVFSPFAEDKRSHRYNPLEYVRDENRVGDLQGIAKIFFPGQSKESFWDEAAANLFLGFGMYLCETPERPRTVGELLRLSSGDGQQSIQNYVRALVGERQGEGRPLSKICVDALNRFCAASDNTAASILATFTTALSLWANPVVEAATETNDFDLRDLRKQRMSVYVVVSPNDLHKAQRLLNLFFSQLVSLNTSQLPEDNPSLKYPCLLLLDEFTAPGKIEILAKAVSYMAGYGLRLMPIFQSKSQLEEHYGKEDAHTFFTNHALQVVFTPKDLKDSEEYSELLGYETVTVKSKSRQMGGNKGGGRSENASEQRRALMLPQELRELGMGKEIIFLENVKPILAEKIFYYEDPNFIARLLPPPSLPLLEVAPEVSPLLPPNKRGARSL